MIQINNIQDIPVDLYYNDPQIGVVKIGTVTTHLQFDDVRVQIKKDQLEGYFVIFNNIRIDINKDGRCDHWPNGFFDTSMNQLMELW